MLSIGPELQTCSFYSTPKALHNNHRCFKRKQRYIFMTQPKQYAVGLLLKQGCDKMIREASYTDGLILNKQIQNVKKSNVEKEKKKSQSERPRLGKEIRTVLHISLKGDAIRPILGNERYRGLNTKMLLSYHSLHSCQTPRPVFITDSWH